TVVRERMRKGRPMPRPRKPWTFGAGKKPRVYLPGTLKQEVDTKARELIETALKPKHVEPPPTGHRLNYITDIKTTRLGSKGYIISIYACPGTSIVSPTFESKFARMRYVGDGKFNLAFMRHTASGSSLTRAWRWTSAWRRFGTTRGLCRSLRNPSFTF